MGTTRCAEHPAYEADNCPRCGTAAVIAPRCPFCGKFGGDAKTGVHPGCGEPK